MSAPAARRADEVARLALVHLPGLGPARGRWLLGAGAPADEVLARLRRGQLPPDVGPAPAGVRPDLVDRWRHALAGFDAEERWQAHRAAGLELLTPSHPLWPFAEDPEPPVVLWARGRLELLGPAPAAAVVGSRRCSQIGRRVAHRLGLELAEAGVVVVSGLAWGIDAAAHTGALAPAGPASALAVVGTGADVVYPASSAALWREVGQRGLVVGEAPLGVGAQRWRFPARNRLVAALVRVVVVVESHAAGGALHTVTEAERRQVSVLAVPGSVLSPASAGSNQLLADGAGVARDAADVLAALSLETAPRPVPRPPGSGPSDTDEAAVLAEVSAGPVALADLLPGRALGEVAVVVERLLAAGQVELRSGMVTLSGSADAAGAGRSGR